MHTPNVIAGSVGKIGNAPQPSKLVLNEGMRPDSASILPPIVGEPRENAASTLFVVLGDDGPGHEHRRRGFRRPSHVGCTLRATPIGWKRLSLSASIRHDATLYPTCDSDAKSSGITSDDDGPTMRRSRRTDPGTPRHPRNFTRPPPRSPGDAQRSSPNNPVPYLPNLNEKSYAERMKRASRVGVFLFARRMTQESSDGKCPNKPPFLRV